MNWGTVLGRGVLGFGVPTSLFLAIFVFALANSSRSVCGISGSKRMPFGNKEQMEDVFISLESNRNGDKINTPVNPGLSEKKGQQEPWFSLLTQNTWKPVIPHVQKVRGDFVYLIKTLSYMFFQLFPSFFNKNVQVQVLNTDQQIPSIVKNFN